MGFWDKLFGGGGGSKWGEWVELGEMDMDKFADEAPRAAEECASRRGKKVGGRMLLMEKGLPLVGKTDEEIRGLAQRGAMANKAEFPKEDQHAIEQGDVCIVAARNAAPLKSGAQVWVRLVCLFFFH